MINDFWTKHRPKITKQCQINTRLLQLLLLDGILNKYPSLEPSPIWLSAQVQYSTEPLKSIIFECRVHSFGIWTINQGTALFFFLLSTTFVECFWRKGVESLKYCFDFFSESLINQTMSRKTESATIWFTASFRMHWWSIALENYILYCGQCRYFAINL